MHCIEAINLTILRSYSLISLVISSSSYDKIYHVTECFLYTWSYVTQTLVIQGYVRIWHTEHYIYKHVALYMQTFHFHMWHWYIVLTLSLSSILAINKSSSNKPEVSTCSLLNLTRLSVRLSGCSCLRHAISIATDCPDTGHDYFNPVLKEINIFLMKVL